MSCVRRGVLRKYFGVLVLFTQMLQGGVDKLSFISDMVGEPQR